MSEHLFSLLPNVRRIIYTSFYSQKETLAQNAAVVMKENGYLQKRDANMAEKTVMDYIDQAKAFALENDILKDF